MGGEPLARIAQLRELGARIQSSIEDYISGIENASECESPGAESSPVLSREALTAQRRLVAAAGRLNSLVLSPQEQLILLSSQHLEARALHIVAAADVPGLIKKQDRGHGHVCALAEASGIEAGKLARILQLLRGLGVFTEVREGVFANNSVSAALAGDENFRAWVVNFGFAMFAAVNHLPAHLLNPSPAHAPKTALGKTMRFGGGIFDWFRQEVQVEDLKHGKNGVGVPYEWSRDGVSAASVEDTTGDGCPARSFRSGYPGAFGTYLRDVVEGRADDELVERPELRVHKMAMVGAGESALMAEYDDYPWASLGDATIVDVGSGLGGFSLRLSKLFPEMKIVLQDLPPMIKQAASSIWPKQHPEAIEGGKVQFTPHDFFTPNSVKEAEVYYLRSVLLDWPDDDAVRILENLKMSMGRNSRVIVSEIIMPSAVESQHGTEDLGCHHRYKYIHDVVMLCGMNGRCRNEAQFRELAERAGLVVKKMWDCRGHGGLVELVLPGCVTTDALSMGIRAVVSR